MVKCYKTWKLNLAKSRDACLPARLNATDYKLH